MSIKSDFAKSLVEFRKLAEMMPKSVKDIAVEACNIAPTVCVDIAGIDDGKYKMSISDGIQKLPFEDFTFKIQARGINQFIRVKRLGDNSIRIIKYNPFRKSIGLNGKVMLDLIVDVNFTDETVKMKYPAENFIDEDIKEEHIKSTISACIAISISMADKMINSLPVVSFKPNKKQYYFSKMPKSLREKFVEYTYSKPQTKTVYMEETEIANEKREHSSPREHVRSGHWRNYKSGKRVWVKSSHVNKNSADGKIEKDYQY